MKKVVAMILALSMVFALCGCASNDYKRAVSLFEEEKYEKAKEIFEKLGDYEESKDYYTKCDTKIKTMEANALFEEGNYEIARQIYDSLGNTSGVQKCDKELYLQKRIDNATEFAGKLLAACAKGFANPTAIVVTGAWYYNYRDEWNASSFSKGETVEDWKYADFTYQLTGTNSLGISQSVYYGVNGIKMDDENISLVSQLFWMNNLLGYSRMSELEFGEGTIKAMQNGIALDADTVQMLFLKNYK